MITVKYESEVLGENIFWQGPEDRIEDIRNVVARDLAKQVLVHGRSQQMGMWKVWQEAGCGEESKKPQYYETKTVRVEGMQLIRGNEDAVIEWIGMPAMAVTQTFDSGINIKTFRGLIFAEYGDYIVCDIHGVLYVVRPDFFTRIFK